MTMLETKEDNFTNGNSYSLNHVCCVCQVSLNNLPFDPTLQTSHGYCEACLEVALAQTIGESHENSGLTDLKDELYLKH